MLELLVTTTIVAVLSSLALQRLHEAGIRAQVAAAQEHLRQVAQGLDLFRLDHGVYPAGQSSGWDDPLGILAGSALGALTSPVAYVAAGAFQDQFGPTRPAAPRGPLDPPMPEINPRQYLLYFAYPKIAVLRQDPRLDVDGYAVVSIGPDKTDSFIAYYPFPDALPAQAALVGIRKVDDTVYDPSNGLRSSGDLAHIGGEACKRGCRVGGGR